MPSNMWPPQMMFFAKDTNVSCVRSSPAYSRSVTDEGVIDKEAIRKELARYNHECQCAEEYVAPPNNVLCDGYEHILREKFTSIFKELKTTGVTKSKIVIEQEFLYHLSKEFMTLT
jgi:hypothetical protein